MRKKKPLMATDSPNGAVREMPPRPKPKGVIRPPAEVEERAKQHLAKIPFQVAPKAKQELLAHLTLEYYYGGEYIAFRFTKDGPEVLAVENEIKAYLNETPYDERRDVAVIQPEPWR